MDFGPAFGDNGDMTSRTTTDSPMRRLAAVIVAAGGGTRMGDGLEKQFRNLAGRSVLAHSVAAFLDHMATARVVIVAAAQRRADAISALGDLASDARVVIVDGGIVEVCANNRSVVAALALSGSGNSTRVGVFGLPSTTTVHAEAWELTPLY